MEAPIKSGALTTAKYALELGREVYAVPGDALRENTKGSNGLIASGATPMINPQELIDTIFPAKKRRAKTDQNLIKPQSPEEAAVIRALATGTKHVDELVEATKLSAEAAQATLTALELRGVIASLGNMRYALDLSAPALDK